MNPSEAFALEVGAIAAVVLLMVVVVAAASACADASAVHDIERALGDATLTTYGQAAASRAAAAAAPEVCAICLSEFGGAGEVVRRVPGCGHFFHRHCGDEWLRSRPTCPVCRRLVALPKVPRPECRAAPPHRRL